MYSVNEGITGKAVRREGRGPQHRRAQKPRDDDAKEGEERAQEVGRAKQRTKLLHPKQTDEARTTRAQLIYASAFLPREWSGQSAYCCKSRVVKQAHVE